MSSAGNDDKAPAVKRTLPKITLEQAVAFMNEKWTTRKCERCGTEGWALHDTRPFAILPISGDVVSTVTDRVAPALMLTCRNCGNMRLTSVENILRFLKELEARQTG